MPEFPLSQIDEPAWFCVLTRPKSEHIAAAGLRTLEGVDVYCPRIRFQRKTKRGKVWFVEALFPCYIFVHFDPTENFRAVRYSHAVSKIVEFGTRVPLIPGSVIEAMREEIGEEEPRLIEDTLQVGDEVVVAEGAMSGLAGIITGLQPGKDRVQVLLDFLGQISEVEMNTDLLSSDVTPREAMGREDA